MIAYMRWLGYTVLAAALAILLALALPTYARADTRVMVNLDANDISPEMSEIIVALHDMTVRYPQVPVVWLHTADLGRNDAYAGTTFNRIAINESYADNPWMIHYGILNDQQMGFHPRGCTPARMLAIHEFAHVLDNHLGRDARWIVKWLYGDGRGLPLTGYSFNPDGTLFVGEALANAFTAVECGVANDVERHLHQILVNS